MRLSLVCMKDAPESPAAPRCLESLAKYESTATPHLARSLHFSITRQVSISLHASNLRLTQKSTFPYRKIANWLPIFPLGSVVFATVSPCPHKHKSRSSNSSPVPRRFLARIDNACKGAEISPFLFMRQQFALKRYTQVIAIGKRRRGEYFGLKNQYMAFHSTRRSHGKGGRYSTPRAHAIQDPDPGMEEHAVALAG